MVYHLMETGLPEAPELEAIDNELSYGDHICTVYHLMETILVVPTRK